MTGPRHEQLFALLIAVWGGVFTWSIVGFVTAEPTGDGFTRGLNRVTSLLTWQLAAAAIAVPVFIVGRDYARGHWLRWISRIPLALAVALFLAIAGIIAWARTSA